MVHDDAWLKSLIRDVPDFPEPGVVFKDITPLLADIDGLRYCVDALVDHYAGDDIDWVVGMEARGFIFGAPFAYRFGAGFVPIRKKQKAHDNFLEELSKGDKVVTNGGLYGEVTKVEGAVVILRLGPDNVRVRISKQAIAGRETAPAEKGT